MKQSKKDARPFILIPKIEFGAQEFALGIYIFCYILVNMSFLTEFPFVHSDEAWLSGLTRNMMETGSVGVTEPFFDLMPRHPHVIKVIFHLLQMPMLAVFSYDAFAVRLLSLIFGCVTLILFYILLKTVFSGTDPGRTDFERTDSGRTDSGRPWGYPLAGTVLLSLDVQFIYASHFARQEIILVCCMTACILAILKNRYLTAGLITGLSIGLHPNSFLIGTMCAVMLIPFGRERRRRLDGWKPLLGYASVTAAFAFVFVLISLSLDRKFFQHYLAYGNSEFDVGAPVTSKLAELPYFLEKIWYGVSGTYYVPDIRFEFILFALAAAAAAFLLLTGKAGGDREMLLSGTEEKQKEIALAVKGILGILAGSVIIGRYNQTSIIFLFPLFYLLTLLVVDRIMRSLIKAGRIKRRIRSMKQIPIALLILITAAVSVYNITPWLNHHYEDYIKEISKAVSPQDKVLANLNCEFYFDNGKLLDYRNLSYLKENNMTVGEYIRKNKIEYIILSDEMDLIYSQRPIWNMIYGNLRYMDELHRFISENCTPAGSFKNDTYGVRIRQYMDSDRDFTVQIFKVKDFSR